VRLAAGLHYTRRMKVRWTGRAVRVRIDDLELAQLGAGQPLHLTLAWPGGGWTLALLPAQADGVSGQAGQLRVGLAGSLAQLQASGTEGVRVDGAVRVDVEKDFGPQHLD
jgi:hypothetical protein